VLKCLLDFKSLDSGSCCCFYLGGCDHWKLLKLEKNTYLEIRR